MITRLRLIIGSGYMGRTHIEALKRLPDVAAVAVAGGKRAPGLAERYGIDFVEAKEQLLRRPVVDAIVITTPHHLHVDEALEAIAHGKHVLVEKPLATSAEDGERLIAAAAKRGVALAVGYQQRFRINNQKACDWIRAGAIGRPYVYGLAVGGAAGVEHVLKLLRQELLMAMSLLGCPTIPSITRDVLWR